MAMTEADGGYTPTSDGRLIRPRRGLPNGRAVVGALLVTISAVGAFAAATRGQGGPSTSYVVATRPVEAGRPISIDDVAVEPMELSPTVRANALRSPHVVEGATAIHDLEAGDLLSVHDLVPGPVIDGEPVGAVHELALPVARDRMVAETSAGDRVTVLATLRLDEEPVTVVAVEDALVLGWIVDGGVSGSGVLTLALDDAPTVAALAHLVFRGDITVVRTTRAVRDEYPAQYSLAGPGAPAGGRGGSDTTGATR